MRNIQIDKKTGGEQDDDADDQRFGGGGADITDEDLKMGNGG